MGRDKANRRARSRASALQAIFTLPLSVLFVCVACAQMVTTATPAPVTAVGPYVTPAQLPPTLLRQFFALGDRLMKPGNERVTLTGTLTTANGTSGTVIVLELGGKLNVTWPGLSAARVVFDGTTPSVVGNVLNSNDLLEAFVDDLPDTLMLAVTKGTSPRLLGQRYTTPAGGFCDYYDVATYGQTNKQSKPLVKRYCFDSATSLLSSVRYITPSSQLTVTQFDGWATVNKQAVPYTIIRTLGGTQSFRFQVQNAIVSPSVADKTFAP